MSSSQPQLKVFVSSTYNEFRQHREALLRNLQMLKSFGVVSMETSGASEDNPEVLSLRQLDECNVYLGLIGHCWGTSLDGNNSIVKAEYLRALELSRKKKMRLLIALAGDKLTPPMSILGKPEDQEKQKEFRVQVTKGHVVIPFETEAQMLSGVIGGLAKLLDDPVPPVPDLHFFGADDEKAIQDKFEISDERTKKIAEVFEGLRKLIEPLFRIDVGQERSHGLFEALHEVLQTVIPGVSLDGDEGILKRTGVRHVILRRETALLLVKSLEDKVKLFDAGREIGEGAAKDLIKNTIEQYKLVPKTAKAFIMLLDYWDRTGGWGRLKVGGSKSDEWEILIENNFLHVGEGTNVTQEQLDATHKLCNFWCGYIHGVLNQALPAIRGLMLQYGKDFSNIEIPATSRVKEVTHKSDNTLMNDTFTVIFEPSRLAEAFKRLSYARRDFAAGFFRSAASHCDSAVHDARRVLGNDFEPLRARAGEVIDERAMACILTILNENPTTPSDKETAEAWFNAASLFIGALTQIIEQNSK